MPISPMPRARSSGLVTSATYACATRMFPPEAPSSIRASSITQNSRDSPRIRNEIAVPAWLKISSGRRP
jgi:hypothetical protein